MKASNQTQHEFTIQDVPSNESDVDQSVKMLEINESLILIELDREEFCFIRSSN